MQMRTRCSRCKKNFNEKQASYHIKYDKNKEAYLETVCECCEGDERNMKEIRENLKKNIRNHADFPKAGIQFKDLNSLYEDNHLFNQLLTVLLTDVGKLPTPMIAIDYVAGIEARGFILGSALAHKLHCGFIPIRKKGKLPGKVKSKTYSLEYGTDSIEIQDKDLKDKNVLIVDDVFATGGTMKAAVSLLESLGAKTSFAVILDIGISNINDLMCPKVVVLQ